MLSHVLSYWGGGREREIKSLPPSMNNLFKGIPFFHEEKTHEYMQMSLLALRRTKRNLAFSLVFAAFQIGLSAENSYFDGKERMANALIFSRLL